jgi:hypothetical protein
MGDMLFLPLRYDFNLRLGGGIVKQNCHKPLVIRLCQPLQKITDGGGAEFPISLIECRLSLEKRAAGLYEAG